MLTREWLDVTPGLAASWLPLIRGHHGPFEDDKADRIAADMTAGRWRPQQRPAIKFDHCGYLRDGRHRITAVARSGCTVRLFAARAQDADDTDLLQALVLEDQLRMGTVPAVTQTGAARHVLADYVVAQVLDDDPGAARALLVRAGIDPGAAVAWLVRLDRHLVWGEPLQPFMNPGPGASAGAGWSGELVRKAGLAAQRQANAAARPAAWSAPGGPVAAIARRQARPAMPKGL